MSTQDTIDATARWISCVDEIDVREARAQDGNADRERNKEQSKVEGSTENQVGKWTLYERGKELSEYL
ncbi:MAG: hypothetical protein E6I80_09990 [Chloroflexi bacterium]|nr:MAG: hypothetical protein E6I80_09990 [Chloroflexota bacterium]